MNKNVTMPPLPEADWKPTYSYPAIPLYTAKQMEEYARAYAASLAKSSNEPFGWAREWQGDVSDLNNYMFTTDKGEVDDDLWFPLFTGPQSEDPEWQQLRDLFGLDGWHDGHNHGRANPAQIVTHTQHVSQERARLLFESTKKGDHANIFAEIAQEQAKFNFQDRKVWPFGVLIGGAISYLQGVYAKHEDNDHSYHTNGGSMRSYLMHAISLAFAAVVALDQKKVEDESREGEC